MAFDHTTPFLLVRFVRPLSALVRATEDDAITAR
jgi:hypothetical protein